MSKFVKVEVMLSMATMDRIASSIALGDIKGREDWLNAFDNQIQLEKDLGFDVFHDIKNQIGQAMERLSA